MLAEMEIFYLLIFRYGIFAVISAGGYSGTSTGRNGTGSWSRACVSDGRNGSGHGADVSVSRNVS